jgi:hypothetical protein
MAVALPTAVAHGGWLPNLLKFQRSYNFAKYLKIYKKIGLEWLVPVVHIVPSAHHR